MGVVQNQCERSVGERKCCFLMDFPGFKKKTTHMYFTNIKNITRFIFSFFFFFLNQCLSGVPDPEDTSRHFVSAPGMVAQSFNATCCSSYLFWWLSAFSAFGFHKLYAPPFTSKSSLVAIFRSEWWNVMSMIFFHVFGRFGAHTMLLYTSAFNPASPINSGTITKNTFSISSQTCLS